jgi:hypothetical protein
MRRTFGIFTILVLTIIIEAPASEAQEFRHYPWCLFTGGSESSIEICAFDTFEQCLLTRSGGGGICFANPAYPGVMAQPRRPRRGALSDRRRI